MLDGPDIDPWAFIEALRANPHISPEDLAQIEAVHAEFERFGRAFADKGPVMEGMRLAFGYGAIIGSYVNGGDPAVLAKFVEEQNRRRGEISGEVRRAPTRERVKALGTTIRNADPNLSRAKLAGKILDAWGAAAPSLKTIERHLSMLDADGELPKPSGKRGRELPRT